MLEIEAKFAVDDYADLEARLRAAGAALVSDQPETDRYYAHPCRSLKQTGEAFRLRRKGEQNCLTYKGPKLAGPVKTRAEVEVGVADGDRAAADTDQLLLHLGFSVVADVRKRRRLYALARAGFEVHVSLDELHGGGKYAEVEVVAPPEAAAAAQAAVTGLAAEWGLTKLERRSYLELHLAATGEGDR